MLATPINSQNQLSESFYRFWGKASKSEPLKDYHLAAYHNLDVAAVGHELLVRDVLWRTRLAGVLGLSESDAISFVTLLLSWHDIGKFSEPFQNLVPELHAQLQGRVSKAPYEIRHDTAGYILLKSADFLTAAFKRLDYRPFGSIDLPTDDILSDDILWPLLRAVCGHHGLPPATKSLATGDVDSLFPETCYEAAISFLVSTCDLLSPKTINLVDDSTFASTCKRLKKASWLLAGFSVLSDWLGSNSDAFKFVSQPMALQDYWRSIALPVAARLVSSVGITGAKIRPIKNVTDIFPKLKSLTPLQEVVSNLKLDASPRMIVIEDVTGAGKTEAALVAAHKMIQENHGTAVYFGLPTMASANGIYKRIVPVFPRFFSEDSKPSLVLAHSRSKLFEHFSPEVQGSLPSSDEDGATSAVSWFSDSRKKSLLANFGVGTIDQALIGVLPFKHQSLRLLGLARGVLIIDEVHAYDEYVQTLLLNLLEYIGFVRGSVILLSATLPFAMKQKLIEAYRQGLGDERADEQGENPYPCVDIVEKGSRTHRISCGTREEVRRTVRLAYVSELNVALDAIRKAAENGQCVCWIRNTIGDAIEAADILAKSLSSPPKIFHSRFCVGDRRAIENEILSAFGPDSAATSRSGRVIVATQVVEQSLDLDFDLVVSDLAPIDLIIQRAGRLCRHSRDKSGNRIVGGRDRRGQPQMIVYGPSLDGEIKKTWYRNFSERAAYVYPNQVHLWKTAKLIQTEGKLDSPRDLRDYVEKVYREDDREVPSELIPSADRAEGEAKSKRSVANLNRIKFASGYDDIENFWESSIDTPTRLAEDETINTTILIWENGRLSPIYNDSEHPFELSEVGIKSHLSADYEMSSESKSIQAALTKIQDHPANRWRKFLVLEPESAHQWSGRMQRPNSKLVHVKYSSTYGLSYSGDHDAV